MDSPKIPTKRRRFSTSSPGDEANDSSKREGHFVEEIARNIKQEPRDYSDMEPNSFGCDNKIKEGLHRSNVCTTNTNTESEVKARSDHLEVPVLSSTQQPAIAQCSVDTTLMHNASIVSSNTETVGSHVRRSLRHQRDSLITFQSVPAEETSLASVMTSFNSMRGIRRNNRKTVRQNSSVASEVNRVEIHDVNDVFKRRFRKMLKDMVAKRMQKLQHSSVFSGSVSDLSRKVAFFERRNRELEEQAQRLQLCIDKMSKEKTEERVQTFSRGTQVSLGMILSRSGSTSRTGRNPMPVPPEIRPRPRTSNNLTGGPVIVHVTGQHVPVRNSPSQMQPPVNNITGRNTMVQPNDKAVGTGQYPPIVAAKDCPPGVVRHAAPYEKFILPEHRLLGVEPGSIHSAQDALIRRFQDTNWIMSGERAMTVPALASEASTQFNEERCQATRSAPVPNLDPQCKPRLTMVIGPNPVRHTIPVPPLHSVPLKRASVTPQNPIKPMGQVRPSLPDQPIPCLPRANQPPQDESTCLEHIVNHVPFSQASILQNGANESLLQREESPKNTNSKKVSTPQPVLKGENQNQKRASQTSPKSSNSSSGNVTASPYVIRTFHELLPDSYPNVRRCSYRRESLSSLGIGTTHKSNSPSELRGTSSQLRESQRSRHPLAAENRRPLTHRTCCPQEGYREEKSGTQIEANGCPCESCRRRSQAHSNCNCLQQRCSHRTGYLEPCQTTSTARSCMPLDFQECHHIGSAIQTDRSHNWPRPLEIAPSSRQGTKDALVAADSRIVKPAQEVQGSTPVQQDLHQSKVPVRPPEPSGHATSQQCLSPCCVECSRLRGEASCLQHGHHQPQNGNSTHVRPFYVQSKDASLQSHVQSLTTEGNQQRQARWQKQHQQRADLLRPPSLPSQEHQSNRRSRSGIAYKQYDPQGPPPFLPQTPCIPGQTIHFARDHQPIAKSSFRTSFHIDQTRSLSSHDKRYYISHQNHKQGHSDHGSSQNSSTRGAHISYSHNKNIGVGMHNGPAQQENGAMQRYQGSTQQSNTNRFFPVDETVQSPTLSSPVLPNSSGPGLSSTSFPSLVHQVLPSQHVKCTPTKVNVIPTENRNEATKLKTGVKRQSLASHPSTPHCDHSQTHSRESGRTYEKTYQSLQNQRAKSPTPLKIIKPVLTVELCENGIVLSWDLICRERESDVLKYELFVNSVSSDFNVSNNWERIGAVDALALPMACTLSQFIRGASYHFAIRAINSAGHLELFSEPCSIMIA